MMIDKRTISFVSLGAAMLVAGLSAQPARDARPVASVGNRSILAADLQERIVAERKQALAENRLDAYASKATDAALQQLVDVKLFAEEARREGLPQRADVQHAIANAVDEVLAGMLLQDRARLVAVDQAALQGYYDAHPREFETTGRVKARHIVVKSHDEAASLLGRLRRNADFADLARVSNIDTTRASGGELGWISRGVMVEPFERALVALKIGEISPVIQTSYGFHIVKVEDIEAGARKPFAAVAPQIRQRLLQLALESWKSDLKKKHTVKVHDAVLNSLR
jgi:peptidyl-prolyl cis-trans isomerase C